MILVDVFKPGPDKSQAFHQRHTDSDGQVWELVSQNDLKVPYFAKVGTNGHAGYKQYTLHDGEQIARAMLANLPAGRNVEDITEMPGRPQFRHFRCRDCEWTFYSQHYHPCICPMCGDFGRK
jgi:hypothetical protein